MNYQTSASEDIKVKGKNKTKKKSQSLTIFLFVIPALLIFSVFILYPIFSTFNLSLYSWNGISDTRLFIGIQNFLDLFQERSFWFALRNNALVVLVSLFVQIPLGLIMALLLSSKIIGKKIINILFFLPYLMSTVAIGLLWIFMYDPVNGPINQLLNAIGLDPIHWLAGGTSSLVAILIVMVWQFAPFYMILFRASMVGIPEELYESASIDGATEAQKFRFITLPALMPTIVSSSILAVVGSLKTFDLFFIMTGGGAGVATEILGTFMYRQSFGNFNMGYGSAVSTVMFFIALIAVILIQFTDYKRRKRGGV